MFRKFFLLMTVLMLTSCTLPQKGTPLPPTPEPVLATPAIIMPTPALVIPTETLLPTATVVTDPFCADQNVQTLLANFKTAIQTQDGELLASLVSPTHGMDVRYWRNGRLVKYDRKHARWLFRSTFVVNWGAAPGSGLTTKGSFHEVVLPKLQDVFNSSYQLLCKDPGITSSISTQPWPDEYAGVGFYNIYRPGTEQYGGIDWLAWLTGVEYVNGQPYLYALIHFEWEP
jgi:hypothetical protein